MPGCGMHNGPKIVSVARNPDKPTQNKLKNSNKKGHILHKNTCVTHVVSAGNDKLSEPGSVIPV